MSIDIDTFDFFGIAIWSQDSKNSVPDGGLKILNLSLSYTTHLCVCPIIQSMTAPVSSGSGRQRKTWLAVMTGYDVRRMVRALASGTVSGS